MQVWESTGQPGGQSAGLGGLDDAGQHLTDPIRRFLSICLARIEPGDNWMTRLIPASAATSSRLVAADPARAKERAIGGSKDLIAALRPA